MKKLCLLLSVFSLQLLIAQDYVDLGNAYWRFSPRNNFDYPNSNNSEHKRHFNMYVLNAKAPIVINDKSVLIIGLEHMQQTVLTTNNEWGIFANYSFGSSMLQLGWEQQWNDRSKMLFMGLGRLNSDFNEVDLAHFQIGGLALGSTRRSENFDWKYGAYVNSELFGTMVVPLFGFNWKMNESMRLKLLIPLNFEYSYQPKSWLRAGLRFEGVNGSYAFQSVPGGSWTDKYIDRADNNLWAFSEFKIGGNFWLHFKAGHSILRKYRVFDQGDKMLLKLGPVNIGDHRNNDHPQDVAKWFDNGYSFEARIIYRFPLKK